MQPRFNIIVLPILCAFFGLTISYEIWNDAVGVLFETRVPLGPKKPLWFLQNLIYSFENYRSGDL